MNFDAKFQEAAERILQRGEKGCEPWKQPWRVNPISPNIVILQDKPIEKIPVAEAIIKGTGAQISHVIKAKTTAPDGTWCHAASFLNPEPPFEEFITMPVLKAFNNNVMYYSTLFHEMGHWTGSKRHLARATRYLKDQQNNAVEEMTAELTSAFVLNTIGLDNTEHHTGYLLNWSRAVDDFQASFLKACVQARDAADFILNKA